MKQSTLAAVASVQNAITSMVGDCAATKNRTELHNHVSKSVICIANAIATVGAFKRSTVKTRKSIEVVHNTIHGLINGLESESITLPEFRAVCKDLVRVSIPRIVGASTIECDSMDITDSYHESTAEVETETEVAAPQSVVEEALVVALDNGDWRNNLQKQWAKSQSDAASNVVAQGPKTVKKTGNGNAEQYADFRKQLRSQLADSNTGEVLHRIKAEGHKLPTKLRGGYGLARLPIIPMFENPMAVTSKGLKSVAIRHSDIGGYPVLEDQYILLVSKKEMRGLKTVGVKSKKSITLDKSSATKGPVKAKMVALPSNAKIELNNRPLVDYARSIVQILNDHTQIKFVLASERFVLSPRNADHVCFWIMPAQKLSALGRVTSHTKVQSWDFPFSIEDFSIEH
jgi:hypothetical protein